MSNYLTLKVPYSNELAKEFFEFLELPLMSCEDISALPDDLLSSLITDQTGLTFKMLSQLYITLINDNRGNSARMIFNILDIKTKDASLKNSSIEVGGVRDAFKHALKQEDIISCVKFLEGRKIDKFTLAFVMSVVSSNIAISLLKRLNLTNLQMTIVISNSDRFSYIKTVELIKFFIKEKGYKAAPSVPLIKSMVYMYDLKNSIDEEFINSCMEKKVVERTVLWCANNMIKPVPDNQKKNMMKLLGYIIDNGFWKIDAVLRDKKSLIWIGLYNKNLDLFKFAIDKGADLTKKNNEGISLAKHAITNGPIEAIKMLSKNGSYSNSEILQRAICDNNLKVVEDMLKLGVDPNKGTINGLKLVEYARSKRNYELTELLQEYGS